MKKLRLATVFSGIGAPEQALNKMNIPYDIVFACDNGERELQLTKEEIIEKATKKETVKKTVKKETTETMAEATKTPRKMTKVSDTVLEIFETKVSMKDLEAVIKKEVKANGLKGEIKIYLNAEQRAAYYTVDGQGSDDFKVDLTTLAE